MLVQLINYQVLPISHILLLVLISTNQLIINQSYQSIYMRSPKTTRNTQKSHYQLKMTFPSIFQCDASMILIFKAIRILLYKENISYLKLRCLFDAFLGVVQWKKGEERSSLNLKPIDTSKKENTYNKVCTIY